MRADLRFFILNPAKISKEVSCEGLLLLESVGIADSREAVFTQTRVNQYPRPILSSNCLFHVAYLVGLFKISANARRRLASAGLLDTVT